MHVTVIFILGMLSVGSMCAPHFRKEVLRDRAKRYLDVIHDIRDNIHDRVINTAQTIRGRARDVGARIDPGLEESFLGELFTGILQPLFNIKDKAITKIKSFVSSLLADSIKDVINDLIPENFFLYLGLGLGIIAVSLVCCVGWCCAGYFTILKELKNISGNMTKRADSLPSKDIMYVNCLDRH